MRALDGTSAPPPAEWPRTIVEVRGAVQQILIYTRRVLCCDGLTERQVLLVIARDPAGVQPGDFFLTTNLEDTGEQR